jgi:hypothetical protein
MPLRDHFHPPLSERRRWDGVHGAWPAVIVMGLNRRLPRRYVAAPAVHLGSSVEIDVATFDRDEAASVSEGGNGGGVATTVWAPPRPTLAVATDLPAADEYEVRIYDERDRRLVAAVEIVSPADKDRPGRRRVFAAKCAAMMQQGVCVAIVDLVTNRLSNLYGELLEMLGQADPALAGGPPAVYASACRWAREGEYADRWRLETWAYPLEPGRPLPTLPIWLASNFAVPLDLEASYGETCRALRIA